MWLAYFQPATLADVLQLLQQHREQARIVAGGTNLLVDRAQGREPPAVAIDISRVAELRYLQQNQNIVQLGALTTYNDMLMWPNATVSALPLLLACQQVAVPQIRNRATIVGNLVHASPAGDTIPPLVAMGAELVLASTTGERVMPLRAFFQGPRQTLRQPNELVREVRFPALKPDQRSIFVKLGMRAAQTISVVNLAIILTLDPATIDSTTPTIRSAVITLGSVAPTIIQAEAASAYLQGQPLTSKICQAAGDLASQATTPIDDQHCSAAYRRTVTAALITQALARIAAGDHTAELRINPVLLQTPNDTMPHHTTLPDNAPVLATINGTSYQLSRHKPLLEAIREDAGLTGTKRGCGEGRCGACTIWLDGQAVMSCITPAPQAHQAEVVTIEGLPATATTQNGQADGLHPLQQALMRHGAIQCGYCTPGFVMAGARLLAERTTPTADEVKQALSGNICRCTGYSKIIAALLAQADTVS